MLTYLIWKKFVVLSLHWCWLRPWEYPGCSLYSTSKCHLLFRFVTWIYFFILKNSRQLLSSVGIKSNRCVSWHCKQFMCYKVTAKLSSSHGKIWWKIPTTPGAVNRKKYLCCIKKKINRNMSVDKTLVGKYINVS